MRSNSLSPVLTQGQENDNMRAISSSSVIADQQVAGQLQISRPIENDAHFQPLVQSIAVEICSFFNLFFYSLPFFGPTCVLSTDTNRRQELRCHIVPGDGHCLFSSFSYLLAGHIHNNIAIRQLVCGHLRRCSATISINNLQGYDSVESYIAGSRMDECGYGTDLEIKAFCTLFCCDVFVSSAIGWLHFSSDFTNNLFSLYIRIRGEHFDPILEVSPITALERNLEVPPNKNRDYVRKNRLVPENRICNLEATRKRLKDPANKEKNLCGVKKRLEDAANKVKHLQAVKERLKDPLVRQRNLLAAKERLKDPVKKEKNLQAAKQRYYKLKSEKAKQSSCLKLVAEQFFDYVNDHCLEFICFSCEQLFYRDQVDKLSEKLASKLAAHNVLRSLRVFNFEC